MNGKFPVSLQPVYDMHVNLAASEQTRENLLYLPMTCRGPRPGLFLIFYESSFHHGIEEALVSFLGRRVWVVFPICLDDALLGVWICIKPKCGIDST